MDAKVSRTRFVGVVGTLLRALSDRFRRAGPRGRSRKRARASILVAAVLVVALNVGLSAAVALRPGLAFAAFDRRTMLVRERIAAAGGERPALVVMMGTSRTEQNFDAGRLEQLLRREAGAPFAVVNFGAPGTGPITQQIYLRRLLAQGIRPDLLILEILHLNCQEVGGRPFESYLFRGGLLTHGEIDLVARYGAPREYLLDDWRRAVLNPWFEHRFQLLGRVRPSLVPPGVVVSEEGGRDAWGWRPYPLDFVTREEYERGRALSRHHYGPVLGDYRPSPDSRRALADLLELCRSERVPVLLVRMPEGDDFRAMTSPASRARLDELFAEAAAPAGVAVVDAQTWMPDDLFRDGHHLLRKGAALFTERLGREHVLPRFTASGPVAVPPR
jgi:hypothetical protein